MGTGKRINYDDTELCLDIARGEMTYAEMAAKHGISEALAGAIARGEKRPALQEKIALISEGLATQARRLGRRLAIVAMGRLGSLAAKDSEAPPDVQRKAAVDILAHAIGDPGKAEVKVTQNQTVRPGLANLPPALKREVLTALDGPQVEADAAEDGEESP